MHKKNDTPDAVPFGWFYRLLQRLVERSGDSQLSELINDFLMPRFLNDAKHSPIRASFTVVRAVAFFYPSVFFSTAYGYIKERISATRSKDAE